MIRTLESLNSIFNTKSNGKYSRSGSGHIIYSNDTVKFMHKLKNTNSLEGLSNLAKSAEAEIDKIKYSISSSLERISTIRKVSNRMLNYSTEAAQYSLYSLTYSTEGKFKETVSKVVKWIKEMWQKLCNWVASRWKWLKQWCIKILNKVKDFFRKKKDNNNQETDKPENQPENNQEQKEKTENKNDDEKIKVNNPEAKKELDRVNQIQKDPYSLLFPDDVKGTQYKPLSQQFINAPEKIIFDVGVKTLSPLVSDNKINIAKFNKKVSEFLVKNVYEKTKFSFKPKVYNLKDCLGFGQGSVAADRKWVETLIRNVEVVSKSLDAHEHEMMNELLQQQKVIEQYCKKIDPEHESSDSEIKDVANISELTSTKYTNMFKALNEPIIVLLSALNALIDHNK